MIRTGKKLANKLLQTEDRIPVRRLASGLGSKFVAQPLFSAADYRDRSLVCG
jgi:hypothetical protein